MPDYPQPLDAPPKKKKDPLGDYFGQPVKQTQLAPPPPPAPPPAPAATNVGTAATAPAAPAAPHRQTPGNFTNFNRVIAANKDVSNREAQAYGQRAKMGAEKAQQSLDALRARFGAGVAAGTVQGTGGEAGQLELYKHSSDGTGPAAEELLAKGEARYGGPGSIEDTSYITDPQSRAIAEAQNQATYADSLSSEQNLGALGDEGGIQALIQEQNQLGNKGTSRFSSNLIGQAGRKDFDALRARFNPDADMTKAVTDSATQANAAEELSKKNAGEWTAAGDYQGRVDAEMAKVQKRQDEIDAADAANAATNKSWQDDFNATDKGDGRLAAKSIFEYLDPINYVSGGKRGVGMKFFGDTFGEDYKGNISWQDSPLDKDVYSQMDAEQWNELSGLTGVAQRNWINRRAAELKNGTGRKRGTYVSAHPK